MTLRVKLFAVARDLAARDELSVDLPQGATIATLRENILAAHPQLAPVLAHALWAVDQQYADIDTPLTTNSEIALIPPVSGG